MSESLNPAQRAAVEHMGSPLLVLAGAGSGKTRVITRKIAWLIEHQGAEPRGIFAVTFTNKAAREMKKRVADVSSEAGLGPGATKGLTVSTFHSLGLRILRAEGGVFGLRNTFSIIDPADSLVVIREQMRVEAAADDGIVEQVRNRISTWKNDLVDPAMAEGLAMTDTYDVAAARVYEAYDRHLRACNAVDLDDLIYLPIRLFRDFPPVHAAWRQRVRYLLVDEYQDTNKAQYELVRLLTGNGEGLTVVGDDDQSIYAWRGARPENLVRLGKDFPNMELVRLEQNYRSMGRILELANQLISNNPRPFEKKLWSDLGFGEPVRVINARNDEHEAERVVAAIMEHRFRHRTNYRDYAILYRGNHQARVLEKKLGEMRIPYYLSGGLSFFERTEIKDAMAYLRLVSNPRDDNAFLRVANTPRRGIGSGALEKLAALAADLDASLLESAKSREAAAALNPRQVTSVASFANWVAEIAEMAETEKPAVLAGHILEKINYREWIDSSSKNVDAAEARWRNVEELLDWVRNLSASENSGSLADVVATISLMGILDRNEDDEKNDQLSLMTLHAAKGLEFPYVYIVGVEEDILPHRSSVREGSVEEERRLFYVGITRARRELTLSAAAKRSQYGEIVECIPSRFLDELPQEHLSRDELVTDTREQKQGVARAHLAAMRSVLE